MRATAFLPLMPVIPALTQRYTEPRHLGAFVQVFERVARGEAVRVVCSVPPRHEKTETAKHAIVWLLLQRPELRVAYVSYAQTVAEKRGRELRDLYVRAGGRLTDASSRRDWRTADSGGLGGVWATSIGGQITGEGFDLIVFDDTTKDRATAESGIERAKLIDWYTDTLSTRAEPKCSFIGIGTRWHVGDLIGWLIMHHGWENICLPAIDENGRALCPERYSLEALTKIRAQIGEYGWASLYMGMPTPRGGAVFRDCYFYDDLPTGELHIKVGVDFAYSTRSRADYSAATVLAEQGGQHFVLEVVRVQVAAPDFLSRLQALQARYGGVRACAYIGGTEKGTVDTMVAMGGLQIDARPATVDKFTRSQPVAAAWNAGKILVPRKAAWLDAFVSEVVSFTGVRDPHDDQVDALASAFDALAQRGRVTASPPAQEGGWVTSRDLEATTGIVSDALLDGLTGGLFHGE